MKQKMMEYKQQLDEKYRDKAQRIESEMSAFSKDESPTKLPDISGRNLGQSELKNQGGGLADIQSPIMIGDNG